MSRTGPHSPAGVWPTGHTRVAAVIGDPVRHSLSPTILNAAFAAAGLDWVYAAFEVSAGSGAAALDAVRTLGFGGLSVTMPLKAEVAAAVDVCAPEAAVLGAVNCVARRGDQLIGYNTDGPGLVDALRLDEGFDPAGRRCAVVGAGGAARAVIHALAAAGAAQVLVVNRSSDRAVAAAAMAGDVGAVGDPAALGNVDLVVQATPVGMHHTTAVSPLHPGSATDVAAASLPFDPTLLRAGQLVVDLIYEPSPTPLVLEARAQGAHAVNGLGMLIHQAAHAFRAWTGEDAPLGAMSSAAVAALQARTRGET